MSGFVWVNDGCDTDCGIYHVEQIDDGSCCGEWRAFATEGENDTEREIGTFPGRESARAACEADALAGNSKQWSGDE